MSKTTDTDPTNTDYGVQTHEQKELTVEEVNRMFDNPVEDCDAGNKMGVCPDCGTRCYGDCSF